MPPRRRGKTATARAAAIQAVQRKRLAQQQQGSGSIGQQHIDVEISATLRGHHQNHDMYQHGIDDIDFNEDDEDIPPPLVDDVDDTVDHVVLVGESEGCLHCHRTTSNANIQVRCDECQAFICETCHWCHEYQANHEIRVCDRCDAFYCRTCDEMDQCDDCGEVVCTSCSTLLSCKFCGGGLCEECATACGRCGIVLCSRDAKFAVDCDTCRLSYCLVCLASGSKDSCVRCGHRPSKRMEQLVHLRLKSIYKAFKQSSRNSKVGGDFDEVEDDEEADEEKVGDDPRSLLQAAASVASKPEKPGKSSSTQAKEMLDKYMAEKEKADAAAAALLAELDEEEAAIKTRKKKKKRKKVRMNAKKEEERTKEDDLNQKDDTPSEAEKTSQCKETRTVRFANETSPGKEAVYRIPLPPISRQNTSKSLETNDNDKKVDPVEERLILLVAESDINGLEAFLSELKGVPGRSGLRKNAKKALKRLRLSETESEGKCKETLTTEQNGLFNEAEPSSGVAFEANLGENQIGYSCQSELLKVVSQTQKPANIPSGRQKAGTSAIRAECVLHMLPSVVGWVIGKGGQRIRDLMEESGAKVWIDQDNMGANDPRVVYVSGHRKCVDEAVKMIQELVAKAPGIGGTSKSSQHTSCFTAEYSNHKATLTKSNVPAQMSAARNDAGSQPLSTAASTEKLNLDSTPSYSEALVVPGDERNAHERELMVDHVHEMDCEARFVPLLIGRRGWTIKHIQDSSGARVDIDQSVTPRKIRIFGKEGNVRTAIRLVSDVLSYPHAQPQGFAGLDLPGTTNRDEQAHNNVTKHGFSMDHGRPDKNLMMAASHLPEVPAERGDSPPPSSLIMPGDAKSTISASSSLSSTPEPSMSSRGNVSHSANRSNDMHGVDHFTQHHYAAPVINQANHHQFALGNLNGDGVALPQSSLPLYQTGMVGMAGPPTYDLRAHPNTFSQQQQQHCPRPDVQPAHPMMGPPVGLDPREYQQQLRIHQAVTQMAAPTHLYSLAPAQQHTHNTPILDYGRLQSGLQFQSRDFQSSGKHFHHQAPHDLHATVIPDHNQGNRGGWRTPAASFLSHETTSNEVPVRSDGFQNESTKVRMDPINRDSLGQELIGLTSPSLNPGGNSVAEAVAFSSANSNELACGRDDSIMVDSLFGPSEVGGNQNILSGFHGLSLNNGLSDMWSPKSTGPGLWERDENKQHTLTPGDNGDHQTSSALYTAIQQNFGHSNMNQSSPSQFGWGDGERQG